MRDCVQDGKRLQENLIVDQLLFESVHKFAQALVLLAFFQYSFVKRVYYFVFLADFVFQENEVALQLSNPRVSLNNLLASFFGFILQDFEFFLPVLFLKLQRPDPNFVLCIPLITPFDLCFSYDQLLRLLLDSFLRLVEVLSQLSTHRFEVVGLDLLFLIVFLCVADYLCEALNLLLMLKLHLTGQPLRKVVFCCLQQLLGKVECLLLSLGLLARVVR